MHPDLLPYVLPAADADADAPSSSPPLGCPGQGGALVDQPQSPQPGALLCGVPGAAAGGHGVLQGVYMQG